VRTIARLRRAPELRAMCAAGLGLLMSLGCGPMADLADSGGAHETVEMPPIELEGVIFEGYHGDLQDLNVLASGATVDMKTHLADLRDVTIHFTAQDNSGPKPTTSKVQIGSPKGQFRLDADDFTLTDGVTGITEEGQRFTTEAVNYVGKTKMLISTVPVEMRRDTLVVTGNGMELAVATHTLHLTGHVRAQALPK
jgi:lipopolysaccharide export system protein LptC